VNSSGASDTGLLCPTFQVSLLGFDFWRFLSGVSRFKDLVFWSLPMSVSHGSQERRNR